MNPDLRTAIRKFIKARGHSPDEAHIERIPGDGSRRMFWRITAEKKGVSVIAMSNYPDDPGVGRENHAYLMIGMHLHQRGIPVPEIYRYDLKTGWFIMEDMGGSTLQDVAVSGDDPLPVYEKVLEHLVRLQIEGASGFDPAWCCQTPRYDRTVMLRYEADYFKEAFLGSYLGLAAEGLDLDPGFYYLAETASKADGRFFLHRDFQSRNIMVSRGHIGFVDWQGGRMGPLGYDLASLIIDPYVRLSETKMTQIYGRYLGLIKARHPAWTASVEMYFPYLAIQRNLQILGAFSYLTQVMNKAYFETYIPDALSALDRLLHRLHDRELSRLRDLVGELRSHKKILDITGAGR